MNNYYFNCIAPDIDYWLLLVILSFSRRSQRCSDAAVSAPLRSPRAISSLARITERSIE